MKSGVQCVLEVRFHGVAVALCRVSAVQGGAVCAIGWSSCEEACHRGQRCPWDAVAQAHIPQALGSSHSRGRGWRRKGVAHRGGCSVHVVGKRWLVAVGLILRGGRAGMASSWTETRAFRGVTVHNPYRRPAAHPSHHTSPARARPRRPGGSLGVETPPSGVRSHTITDAVTVVASDAGTLPGTRRAPGCATREFSRKKCFEDLSKRLFRG